MRLTGDTSPISTALGLLIAVGGVVVFASRFARRQQYRNPRWSDTANWGGYTLVSVLGLPVCGLYLLGLVIYLGGLVLQQILGR